MAGYEKLRFINPESTNSLICNICQLVTNQPKQCTACQTIFCTYCIGRITKCNKCQGSTIDNIKGALLRFYNNLDIKCQNQDCAKVVKVSDLQDHIKICGRQKCKNFDFCQNNLGFQNNQKFCSKSCLLFAQILANNQDIKKIRRTILEFKEEYLDYPKIPAPIPIDQSLLFEQSLCGDFIKISNDRSSCFLSENQYQFRSVLVNKPMNSGIHYWEIHIDPKTQHELKIGITKEYNINKNTCFCDSRLGWAYYGMGSLRNNSNATGANYGQKFKSKGVVGVYLNMQKGILSFSLDGKNQGVAYTDQKLQSGPIYPCIGLLHEAGCKIVGVKQIPACFSQ